MKISILTGILGLAALVGCGRQEPTAPAPKVRKTQSSQAIPSVAGTPAAGTPAAPDPPPTVAASPSGAPGAAAATAAPPTPGAGAKASEYATPEVEKQDVNISMLQEVVGSYTRANKRNPKDLQQLVAEHYLTAIPPAPKGRRYVLDQASQTVKSVSE